MIEIVVGILIAILCIALVLGINKILSEEEQETLGEKALRQQKELNEERQRQWKEEIQATLLIFLTDKIIDHFSSNYILYSDKLLGWIEEDGFTYCFNQKENNKIISILCKELSMDYEIGPNGKKYYYKKEK